MNEQVTLALDAHGGDHGPEVIVPAALDALTDEPRLRILLAGREDELRALPSGISHPRLSIEPVSEALGPGAGPVAALRLGPDSSLGRAVEQVAAGRAAACVSAGNTAALIAVAVKRLGMLPGIRRPALMSVVPSATGFTGLLDLGANLTVEAAQLVQFAIMGIEVRRVEGIASPTVGLLNVGHEDSKGHVVVREAHERLQALGLNYAGFVEGHDIFSGRVDVAVCDGFSGNLVLKSTEGLARMLLGEVRGVMGSGLRARLAGWLAGPPMKRMLARLDPGKHNGAPLLGLRGVVVKSHGGAGRVATRHAILEAFREARKELPGRIEQRIRQYEAGMTS